MFKNKIQIGQILAMIIFAPCLVLGILMISDFERMGLNEETLIKFIIFTVGSITAGGLAFKKYWALQLTTILMLGLFLLLLGTILFNLFVEKDNYMFIGFIAAVVLFFFGIIALLNNQIVLDTFGKTETYDDDILDDISILDNK